VKAQKCRSTANNEIAHRAEQPTRNKRRQPTGAETSKKDEIDEIANAFKTKKLY